MNTLCYKRVCRSAVFCLLTCLLYQTALFGKDSHRDEPVVDDDLSFLTGGTDKQTGAQNASDQGEGHTEDNECFELYGTFIENANKITSTIQHLCQLTGQERTVGKDRQRIDQVIEWLNTVQQENSRVKQTPTMPINKQQLHACFGAQDQVIKVLRESINNSFRHLPDITLIVDDALASDVTRDDMASEKVQARAQHVTKNLKTLLLHVDECGLSGFNKFYTKISPLIPWAIVCGAIGMAAWGGYVLYNKSMESPDARKYFSESIDGGGKLIINNFVNTAFWSIIGATIPTYHWLHKHYNNVDSHLRGNKFKPTTNDQVVVDDIDLDDPCFAHLRDKLLPIYRMVDYIKNPQKFSLAGIKNYKAILLVGEPGSGKSYLARAIAGQLQKEVGHSVMISVTFDHYFEKGGIKKIVEDAKQHSGCVVLFLDEIHLYGVQAEKNVVGLQELLSCLDDLDRETDPQKQVFIIAATNRPDLIEDPLKRQGRFGTIIELTKPLYEDRVNILTTLCKKSAVSPEELQVDRIARLTNGRPMSDLVSMFSQACFLAKSENRPVSFEHMYRALNLKLRKLSETLNLKPEEIAVVSAHLAGTTCALLHLKSSQHLDMITLYAEQKKIVARYDILAKIKNDEDKFFIPDPGMVYTYENNELISGIGQDDKLVPVKILLAGLAAQRIMFGAETSYHSIDREKALEAALKIVSGGIELKKLARKERDAILDRAYVMIKECEKAIEELLIIHKSEIELIAKTLAERKMLRVEEIHEIIAPK